MLTEDENHILKRIERTIVSVKPKVKFTDICGLEKHIEQLQQAIAVPVDHSDLFSNRRPHSAFLFYGPPGTEKTYLAKAVAAEIDSKTFFSVSASNLISKYQGESELCINILFNLARVKRPSVIFIDEVDSFGLTRNEGDNDNARRVKNELFVQLDGLSDNNGVFVIATTNTPNNLDPALLRRFDKLIYVPLPDQKARLSMFKQRLLGEDVTNENLEHLAMKTEEFSGSDIDKLCRNALLEPISRLQNTTHFRKSSIKSNGEIVYTPCDSKEDGAVEINIKSIRTGCLDYLPKTTFEDILHNLQKTKPTTSMETTRKLDRFASQVGHVKNIRKDTEKQKISWLNRLVGCCFDMCL